MALRKEILEAIKDGTITPEEGLHLLEEIELAEEINPEDNSKSVKVPESKLEKEHETDLVKESETEAIEELESKPDQKQEQVQKSEPEKSVEEEKPQKEAPRDSVASLIDEWEMNDHQEPVLEPIQQPKKADTRSEQQKKQENDSLTKMNELDQQIDPLAEELKEKKELFRNLNLEVELEIISEENLMLYDQTRIEIADLEAKINQLKRQKESVEKDFYSIPVWQTEPLNYEEKVEDSWDFEEETTDQSANESGTFNSRINQLVNRTLKSVADTVDGKWSDVKIPSFGSVGNTKFEHQFTFREKGITDLDIKLANGTVILEPWSRSDIYVEAEIELHGKMYGEDPLDAFMERSHIECNEDQLFFHVHNKRVSAELTFYLPEHLYDHVKIRLLNGHLSVKGLVVKDIFVKSTKGALLFKNINAGVLEIQGTDNEIDILNGTIIDSIIETVSGSIVSKADVTNFDASLVNGQIKLSVGNSDLKKIKANSVNGTIKISLPTTIGLEGIVKTSLGEINYRLSDFQTVRERRDRKQRLFHFRRSMGSAAQIDISSKTGTIFLKDFDR
ncbi:daptomycin-sensing surface protein LiaX [Enterococcus sp. AZ109]|uniref:daptomycin-sensing surface protein LiaX n=1 Tax=Enterococcus sp. AZ109 TaxID=2774634 RepID=UPI003F26CBA5